jgi:hypothetical protein
MLGYTEKEALKLEVTDFVPAPFGAMHGQWLRRRALPSNLGPSCRFGRTVFLQTKTGRQVPIVLNVKDGDGTGNEGGATMKHGGADVKFFTCRASPVSADTANYHIRLQV